MIRKVIAAVFCVLVILAALAGIKVLQIRTLIAAGKNYAQPPESVASFTVREEKWQGTLLAIGSVTAVQGVNVTTEVPGLVREIAFESGTNVDKGALLVKLDTSSEEAQLRAIEAQWELAHLNLDRIRKLRADNTVSQADLDTAEATLKQLSGNADTIHATIDKKTIRAPFAGQLGIRQVNLGQYLDTGKPIVSLHSPSPIYVTFTLPQQELARLHKGMKIRVTTDTYPDRQFLGELTAINPDLDSTVRSVGLQATFENKDGALRPGMFARVEVLLPEEKASLVVPMTSVLSAPYGDSVYVIEERAAKPGEKPSLVLRQQFVKTGVTRGDFVSIEKGLKPGERIASSGVFKLRNGMSVVENNDLAPKPAEFPKPSDS